MKSWENEVNEDLVADVRGPQVLPVAFINTLVVQAGETFEVWIRWGKKNWQIASGTLGEMNSKRDRLTSFVKDPFAPVPSSVADFVEMAKGV